MKIWHCFLGHESQPDILDALRNAGLQTEARDHLPAQGAGVVFFKDISPQLLNLLGDATRSGMERVLAIALTSAMMKPPAVWTLLAGGASDVFAWDHSPYAAHEVAAKFERWNEVDDIVRSALVRENLAGESAAWLRSLREIVEISSFTGSSVLITGESGTGKELCARLVHSLDRRKNKGNLVLSDCTTVVPELSGSEFFGHERGAFTGAVSARDGAFAMANGGTLFLDEVGELHLNLQAELLRVIQEHTYKRVGGNAWQKTDFRLVCATNRDLLEEQAHGRFRRDLYYRISAWSCRLPSLAERREDILPLARHFICQLRPDDPPELDNAVSQYLLARDYPGNVRNLKQLITRIVQHHVGPGPITVGDIPETERPHGDDQLRGWRETGLEIAVRSAVVAGVSLKEIERAAGELAERIAIEQERGNIQRAAARLGVTDRALQLRRAARRRVDSAEVRG